MNAKLFALNMKWEWRIWWRNTAIPCGVLSLTALMLLLILPVPQTQWHDFIRAILLALLTLASIAAAIVGLYLMFIYPFGLAFRDVRATALLEHMPGNRYIYRLCVRLLINAVSFAVGFGIVWIGVLILQRFYEADAGWLVYILADGNEPLVMLVFAHLSIFVIPLAFLSYIKLMYPFYNIGKRDSKDICASSGSLSATGAMLLINGFLLSRSPTTLGLIIGGVATAILIVITVVLISRKFDKRLEV